MTLLRQIRVVWVKELRDGLRDRRSLFTPLFVSMLMPAALGFVLTATAGSREPIEMTLPVAGAEHAPALVEWLRQQSGISVVPAVENAERAIRERKEDVVILIDTEFAADMAKGIPAPMRILSDSTRERARGKVTRVRKLLLTYASDIAAQRLVSRGLAPSVAAPLRIEDIEISSAQERLAMLLNILPMALVLASLTGGMQLAIDATAGERERGSLEPLLLNPVPRTAFAAGKWLAAATFGCGAVVFSMIVTMAILRRVPWPDLGMRFHVSDQQLLTVLLVVLPLPLLLGALMLVVATFARSFKEAQGYSGVLVLLPIAPGVIASLYSFSNRPWMAPLPILGQYALAADILAGKTPSLALHVLSGGSVLICSLAMVVLVARLLTRERIIFGR